MEETWEPEHPPAPQEILMQGFHRSHFKNYCPRRLVSAQGENCSER